MNSPISNFAILVKASGAAICLMPRNCRDDSGQTLVKLTGNTVSELLNTVQYDNSLVMNIS
jgi:hypothetical protein